MLGTKEVSGNVSIVKRRKKKLRIVLTLEAFL